MERTRLLKVSTCSVSFEERQRLAEANCRTHLQYGLSGDKVDEYMPDENIEDFAAKKAHQGVDKAQEGAHTLRKIYGVPG